jgi:predicted nucleic acid-binding protein
VPNIRAWVDTGFLVALFARDDAYHASALEFLKKAADIEFHLIWPVVTEAAFFLS